MRRWNGWGDDEFVYPVPESVRGVLTGLLGPGRPPRDATIEEASAKAPPSRLPQSDLIETEARLRLTHALGQSLPDWVALRSGQVPAFPDGVARPRSAEQVEALLKMAAEVQATVIPYGGGTSVVGHLTVNDPDRPALSLDLAGLNGLIDLDAEGSTATFGAGISGPDLEAALAPHGFTLGHYPQSFEYSTLGGWIASRSSGQFSLGYGRIEQLFVAGQVVTPAGRLELPPHPASAAGPDLRQLVLGSEGRLGVITRAMVKISPRPEAEVFKGVFLPDPDRAKAAVRDLAQSRLPLTMIRLSLPAETETSLALLGDKPILKWLDRYLRLRGVGPDKCLLIYGAVGPGRRVRRTMAEAGAIIRRHRGVSVGSSPGKEWFKNRFRAPYLRNSLWELGYAVDTLETAVPWGKMPATVADVEAALAGGLEKDDERVHVFTHLSHVYPHGTSVYTTYLFRLAEDPAETLDRWQRLKTAASQAIVGQGGTISHQHGVGLDHRPYLEAEKGELGLDLLQAAFRRADPDEIMNPGKLVE
jgi:alkyldihydroxyacetonephosphate synthase